jgi:predicted PurR-regulated permease PerM
MTAYVINASVLSSHPWASLTGVLITFSIVQWVVEPVAGTLILSSKVKMHPVTVILALLVGGSLFGVFGVILSIPFSAVVRILGEEFLLPPLREMAED